MKAFMDKDFLLKNPTAQTLYHDYAAKMPIVDYHCHINPQEIYENKRFDNIAEAWLGGDHYKWRLMRASGFDESVISGEGSWKDKFLAFAATLPRAIGNPVYHWAHLELQRYFGITKPLNPSTAEEIWEECNRQLREDESLRVRGIIQRSAVKTICTTDDPLDSLEWHEKLAADDSFTPTVLPAWRPDKAVNIDKAGFAGYIGGLAALTGIEINSVEALQKALAQRLDYFAAHGCRASDHGIDKVVEAYATPEELDAILAKGLAGEGVSAAETAAFQFAMLQFLGGEYARRGWIMEIHYGVRRNNSTLNFGKKGPDTGYDCIAAENSMTGLAALLDALEQSGSLPKVLLFSIEPADNARINTLAQCFSEAGTPGKVQQGSAWWFNDSIPGMEQQMVAFASNAVLANFVGMLTDSRSFLSYARHEYFRRILCNLLGDWVENGEYPDDMETLGAMVQDISYNNAVNYFGF